MSEKAAGYKVGDGLSLDEFKELPCALVFSDPDYLPPTPGEIDQLIKAAGWSQNGTAKLVGVSFNPAKGSVTVRRWRAEKGSSNHREIPYSAWRLLLINAGVVRK